MFVAVTKKALARFLSKLHQKQLDGDEGGGEALTLSGAARAFFVCMLLLSGLVFSHVANAAYNLRYATTTKGAITFTGNTLGLSKAFNSNTTPGSYGSIGAFTSTSGTAQVGTYPYGTTTAWASNSSAAVLRIPAGASVVYAELIWGGSHSVNGSVLTTQNLSTPVSLKVGNTTAVAISSSVSLTNGANYVRSANVTSFIQAAGSGNTSIQVAGVPGTNSSTENSSNTAGWTLAVVYEDSTLPVRNLTLFVGAEPAGSDAAQVTGFCTPSGSAQNARVAVSAIEGDSDITGDQFKFGPTIASMSALSGTNNPVGNFFASQINGDTGALDTSGTFGSVVTSNVGGSNRTAGGNHPIGGMLSGARQGWDITNVDASSAMVANQTTAYAQGTTTGDQYVISALGLQIKVLAPSFPSTVKSVDKATASPGEILTYTITMKNEGESVASNVVFSDPIPAGTSFVPNSLVINGVTQNGVSPTGVNVGQIAINGTTTISFKVQVTGSAGAVVSNAASWTYSYQACGTLNGTLTTNSVSTTIVASPPRLTLKKIVNNNHGGTKTIADFTLSAVGPTPISGTSGATAVTNAVVNPGTYTLSETVVAGYSASNWSCSVNGAAAVSGATIALAPGQNAECTITNSDIPAGLTLKKVVNNNHGGTKTIADFTLSAAGPTPISGISGAPAVTNAVVNPGSYTLSENAVAGYSASSWSCTGATVTGNTVVLAAGQSAECTITNSDIPAGLTLKKIVNNNHGGTKTTTDFTLTATGPTTITGTSDTAAVTNAVVNPGSYTLSENVVAGYSASSWSCTGATVTGNTVVLAAGQSAECTITNSDIPAGLTLKSVVFNNYAGNKTIADFILTASGTTAVSGVSGAASVTGAPINPGSYTLSGSNVAGYRASEWSCSIDGAPAVVVSAVTLALGQNAECTITYKDIAGYDNIVTVPVSSRTMLLLLGALLLLMGWRVMHARRHR